MPKDRSASHCMIRFVMEGCLTYNKDHLRLQLSTTQKKKLLNETLKGRVVCGSLKNICEYHRILRIGWQYLISLLALKLGNLKWSDAQGETIPSVYIQSVCHSQIHPRTSTARN